MLFFQILQFKGNMIVNTKKKKGEVRFAFLESDTLLHFFSRYATSEGIGRVQSCSTDNIKSDSFNAMGVGIYACDDLIGAVSYQLTESTLRPGYYSAKLDVVSVVPEIRGMGIGSLLMGTLFLRIAQFFGYNLVHLSTTAVHPAVGHFVAKLGFTTISDDTEGPLYTLRIDGSAHFDEFLIECERIVYEKVSNLRLDCIKCMSFPQPKAIWCIK
jgi:GNAT superfamily N-acetyltransferase